MKIKFKDGTEKDFSNLRGANLSNADLRGADLGDADLGDADMGDADLSNADLSNADLSYADLRGANLSHADLRGANLNHADLRGADLRNADMSGADLDYSCWPLWCGSLSPKIDKRLSCQLLYHALQAIQSCEDQEVQEFLRCSTAITLANQFHLANECGKI